MALTVVITFFFGLFGLIPASLHSSRAKSVGLSGVKYWKAFWITFILELILWIVVSIAIIAAVANAANHAAQQIDDSYSSAPTYAPTEMPTTYDSPTDAPTIGATKAFTGPDFTWGQTSSTGDTTRVTLELGTPVSPGDAPDVHGGTAQDALENCDLDQERDLLVPFDLVMTNTDDSLSQQVSTQLYLSSSASFSGDETVGRIAFFNDGPDCASGEYASDKLLDTYTDDPIAAGAESELGGYFVLAQAVSPNNPSGDPALLRAGLVPLGVAPGEQDSNGTTYTTGDGTWQDGAVPLGAGASR